MKTSLQSSQGGCRISHRGNEPVLPTGTLELQTNPFIPVMKDTDYDPKVAELLNTKVGKYLTEHPFLALVLLVFGLTASVPIGLFLAFAAVTFITVAVCFIFVEIFLLMIGGTTLLCVLFCLGVVSFWVCCALSALYIIISQVLNFCFIRRMPENISAGDMATKKTEW